MIGIWEDMILKFQRVRFEKKYFFALMVLNWFPVWDLLG